MTKTITNSIFCVAFLIGCPVFADAIRCEGNCHLDSTIRAEDYYDKISVPAKNLVLLNLNGNAQAQVLNCFGLYNLEGGKFMEAEQQLKEAVSINEREVRSSSLLLADSLTSLSKVYEKQGNLKQATSLAMRALKIQEKVLALDLADSLDDNAKHYKQKGRMSDAARTEKRALEIRESENQ